MDDNDDDDDDNDDSVDTTAIEYFRIPDVTRYKAR